MSSGSVIACKIGQKYRCEALGKGGCQAQTFGSIINIVSSLLVITELDPLMIRKCRLAESKRFYFLFFYMHYNHYVLHCINQCLYSGAHFIVVICFNPPLVAYSMDHSMQPYRLFIKVAVSVSFLFLKRNSTFQIITALFYNFKN